MIESSFKVQSLPQGNLIDILSKELTDEQTKKVQYQQKWFPFNTPTSLISDSSYFRLLFRTDQTDDRKSRHLSTVTIELKGLANNLNSWAEKYLLLIPFDTFARILVDSLQGRTRPEVKAQNALGNDEKKQKMEAEKSETINSQIQSSLFQIEYCLPSTAPTVERENRENEGQSACEVKQEQGKIVQILTKKSERKSRTPKATVQLLYHCSKLCGSLLYSNFSIYKEEIVGTIKQKYGSLKKSTEVTEFLELIEHIILDIVKRQFRQNLCFGSNEHHTLSDASVDWVDGICDVLLGIICSNKSRFNSEGKTEMSWEEIFARHQGMVMESSQWTSKTLEQIVTEICLFPDSKSELLRMMGKEKEQTKRKSVMSALVEKVRIESIKYQEMLIDLYRQMYDIDISEYHRGESSVNESEMSPVIVSIVDFLINNLTKLEVISDKSQLWNILKNGRRCPELEDALQKLKDKKVREELDSNQFLVDEFDSKNNPNSASNPLEPTDISDPYELKYQILLERQKHPYRYAILTETISRYPYHNAINKPNDSIVKVFPEIWKNSSIDSINKVSQSCQHGNEIIQNYKRAEFPMMIDTLTQLMKSIKKQKYLLCQLSIIPLKSKVPSAFKEQYVENASYSQLKQQQQQLNSKEQQNQYICSISKMFNKQKYTKSGGASGVKSKELIIQVKMDLKIIVQKLTNMACQFVSFLPSLIDYPLKYALPLNPQTVTFSQRDSSFNLHPFLTLQHLIGLQSHPQSIEQFLACFTPKFEMTDVYQQISGRITEIVKFCLSNDPPQPQLHSEEEENSISHLKNCGFLRLNFESDNQLDAKIIELECNNRIHIEYLPFAQIALLAYQSENDGERLQLISTLVHLGIENCSREEEHAYYSDRIDQTIFQFLTSLTILIKLQTEKLLLQRMAMEKRSKLEYKEEINENGVREETIAFQESGKLLYDLAEATLRTIIRSASESIEHPLEEAQERQSHIVQEVEFKCKKIIEILGVIAEQLASILNLHNDSLQCFKYFMKNDYVHQEFRNIEKVQPQEPQLPEMDPFIVEVTLPSIDKFQSQTQKCLIRTKLVSQMEFKCLIMISEYKVFRDLFKIKREGRVGKEVDFKGVFHKLCDYRFGLLKLCYLELIQLEVIEALEVMGDKNTWCFNVEFLKQFLMRVLFPFFREILQISHRRVDSEGQHVETDSLEISNDDGLFELLHLDMLELVKKQPDSDTDLLSISFAVEDHSQIYQRMNNYIIFEESPHAFYQYKELQNVKLLSTKQLQSKLEQQKEKQKENGGAEYVNQRIFDSVREVLRYRGSEDQNLLVFDRYFYNDFLNRKRGRMEEKNAVLLQTVKSKENMAQDQAGKYISKELSRRLYNIIDKNNNCAETYNSLDIVQSSEQEKKHYHRQIYVCYRSNRLDGHQEQETQFREAHKQEAKLSEKCFEPSFIDQCKKSIIIEKINSLKEEIFIKKTNSQKDSEKRSLYEWFCEVDSFPLAVQPRKEKQRTNSEIRIEFILALENSRWDGKSLKYSRREGEKQVMEEYPLSNPVELLQILKYHFVCLVSQHMAHTHTLCLEEEHIRIEIENIMERHPNMRAYLTNLKSRSGIKMERLVPLKEVDRLLEFNSFFEQENQNEFERVKELLVEVFNLYIYARSLQGKK